MTSTYGLIKDYQDAIEKIDKTVEYCNEIMGKVDDENKLKEFLIEINKEKENIMILKLEKYNEMKRHDTSEHINMIDEEFEIKLNESLNKIQEFHEMIEVNVDLVRVFFECIKDCIHCNIYVRNPIDTNGAYLYCKGSEYMKPVHPKMKKYLYLLNDVKEKNLKELDYFKQKHIEEIINNGYYPGAE